MCGLHALHDPADRRLALRQPTVGAIAAWGELEVHAAGFRAEYARVIALAYGPGSLAERGGRLRQAARRYDVGLVPIAELEPEALELASPLPATALPKPRTRRRVAWPRREAAGDALRLRQAM